MISISIKTSLDGRMIKPNDNSVNELTYRYFEGEKKASLSDDRGMSVKIDKAKFISFWEEIKNINFTKVLLENKGLVGLDGFTLTVELQVDFVTASISLWCPSEATYKERGWIESAELMSIVNGMVETAGVLNFSLNAYSNDKEYKKYDEYEEDFESEDWIYEVGDDMDFLPRDAVYSVQIELREIKKSGEDFVMTIAVRDPDSGEYQTFTETLRKGSILKWDGLEPGVVCFTGPNRVAVKLTVNEISEKRINFTKEYDEEA